MYSLMPVTAAADAWAAVCTYPSTDGTTSGAFTAAG